MAEIRLRGLTKRFGRNEVIPPLDLHIGDGSFTVLVGPSGCGKSTLLRLIAGLETASGGELLFDGQTVNALPPKARGVAMVFQSYALYPHMTAYENMAFGLSLDRAPRQSIRERVERAAALLDLEGLLERLPKELSGGQRQRVAIGRAIVREPRVFLFDEPLSNLDAALRVQMRVELARLHEMLGTTVVYVTHDQVEAMTLADRVVVLQRGRVAQAGPPLSLYHRPANQFVAGFIGSPRMNFYPTRALETAGGALVLALPGESRLHLPEAAPGLQPGTALVLGIRPEHLRLAAVDGRAVAGRFEAEVVRVEELGEAHLLHLRSLDGATFTLRGPGAAPHQRGEQVALGLPAGQCHVFDAEGRALALQGQALTGEAR